MEALVFAVNWSKVPLAIPRPWEVLRSRCPVIRCAAGRRLSIVDVWLRTSLSDHVSSAAVSLTLLNDYLRCLFP